MGYKRNYVDNKAYVYEMIEEKRDEILNALEAFKKNGGCVRIIIEAPEFGRCEKDISNENYLDPIINITTHQMNLELSDIREKIQLVLKGEIIKEEDVNE